MKKGEKMFESILKNLYVKKVEDVLKKKFKIGSLTCHCLNEENIVDNNTVFYIGLVISVYTDLEYAKQTIRNIKDILYSIGIESQCDIDHLRMRFNIPYINLENICTLIKISDIK